MNLSCLLVPCLGSSTYSTPGPAVQSQRTLQVEMLSMAGARCRKAGRGGGGMPRIVSGGGPMSEHSTHDVFKYINRSTPLAMLVSCRRTKQVKLQRCGLTEW